MCDILDSSARRFIIKDVVCLVLSPPSRLIFGNCVYFWLLYKLLLLISFYGKVHVSKTGFELVF